MSSPAYIADEPDPDAVVAKPPPKRGVLDDVAGTISSLYRGSIVGDELNAAVEAPFMAGADYVSGKGFHPVEAFNRNLAAQRQQEAGLEQAHPTVHAVAKETGLLAPLAATALTGGAAAPEVAAEAPGLLSTLRSVVAPAAQVGSRTGNMVRGGVTAATGAYGAGLADAGTPMERLKAAGEAAINPLTLGLGTGLGALGPVANAAKGSALSAIQKATTGLGVMRDHAYEAVDDLGAYFKPTSAKTLWQVMQHDLAEAPPFDPTNPDMKGVQGVVDFARSKLNSGQPLSMTTLGQIRTAAANTFNPKDLIASAPGQAIKNTIDDFIAKLGPQHMEGTPIPGFRSNPVNPADLQQKLAVARDMHTRFKKAEALTNALTSADLKTGSTYAGFNIDNATRQAIRPFLDPTHSNYIQNFTPDEAAAAAKIIEPGAVHDALRHVGRASPLTGGLATLLEVGPTLTAAMTGHEGAAAAATGGMAATSAAALASNAMTRANVRNLMNIITQGGTKEAGAALGELQRRGALTPQLQKLLSGIPKGAAALGAFNQAQQTHTLAQGGFVDDQPDPWTEPDVR